MSREDPKEDYDSDFGLENDEFIRTYTEKMLRKSLELRKYTDEEELIRLTTCETMIIHFYSSSFEKCKYMNDVLQKMSSRFPKIRFGFINVEDCPKMCASLEIRVLPFLGFFRNGYFVDRLVGFESLGELSSAGTFQAGELEKFIRNSEIVGEAANF